MRIIYKSPYKDEPPSPRYVSPWGVYFQSHAWYMWAGSEKYPSGATYRVSRIQKCDPIATEYIAPPEGVSVSDYAETAWFGRPGVLMHHIKLQFFMPLAAIVQETVWHPTQKIEPQPDGSIIYTATVPDLEEVARWSMSCAPHIKAIEPKALRERLVQLAKSVIENCGQ